MSDTKQKVLNMLDKHSIGTLATVRDQKPYTRFMLFFHDELTLYTATNRSYDKVEDLQENSSVHILLGYEGKGFQDAYAEIEGRASIEESEELKARFWTDSLKEWISSPNDPDYVLIKIQPVYIRYFDKAGSEPQEIKNLA
ncbi:general stress protein [Bacillus lacus]|uniref:General stress protein n=1 Tax=Metabacillus lacus TaxID=1983721 RepID=A0A7X2M0U5_9BACI|nr:pyridoxamine 5'-phosphate oxidase family protein [Metabacillus lacus]MRX73657.1 general stress protein [Metabacillus lacus]